MHSAYEITDISFGRQEISETNMLMQLHPFYKDVITYESKLKLAHAEDKEAITKERDKYTELFEKQMEIAHK